jgi:TolA-binding protein
MSEAETITVETLQDQLRQAQDHIAELRGEEPPTKRDQREAMEEQKRRGLADLEVKELSRYVDELLPRSDGARVGDEMDQAYNAVADVWGRLKGAISDKREAVKDIEALTRAFGGTLPPAWQEARSAWISSRAANQPSATVTWRRDRFSKLLKTMFGHL